MPSTQSTSSGHPGYHFLHLTLPHSALQDALLVEQAGATQTSYAKLQVTAEERCHQQAARSIPAPRRPCTPTWTWCARTREWYPPFLSVLTFERGVSELNNHLDREGKKATRQETEAFADGIKQRRVRRV